MQCGTKEKHLILEEYIILFKRRVRIVRHDHAGRYMLGDLFIFFEIIFIDSGAVLGMLF